MHTDSEVFEVFIVLGFPRYMGSRTAVGGSARHGNTRFSAR